MVKIIAPELYEPKRSARYNKTRDAFFIARRGIDTAVIAAEMGWTERAVIEYMRKLHLRPLTGTLRKHERIASCRN